jgi:hypothetical protein
MTMMDIFANSGIVLASVTAFLTLLDWFLTDKQKEHLALLSIRLWNWLDDLYKWRFLEWFYKGRPQLVVVTLSVIVYVIFVAYVVFSVYPPRLFPTLLLDLRRTWVEVLVPSAISLILGPILAVIIFRPLLRWLSRSTSQLTYLNRLYATSVPFILIETALRHAGISSWHKVVPHYVPDWAQTPWFIATTTAITIYGTFVLLYGFLFATTISLLCAKTIVYASAFIMRRVAESKKGPLLGITALVGGIAAIVKAMQ